MDYYLLSEQELDEIAWDVEAFLYELRSRIQKKKIEEEQSTVSNEDSEEESSSS